jgi:hypothetical protein
MMVRVKCNDDETCKKYKLCSSMVLVRCGDGEVNRIMEIVDKLLIKILNY